ncbi:MAG: hypothetical protein J6M05_04140 [Cardiobacteriaceae bacterium]|nr:hypothetical protein [Cardiobacteriaceae bacterium]
MKKSICTAILFGICTQIAANAQDSNTTATGASVDPTTSAVSFDSTDPVQSSDPNIGKPANSAGTAETITSPADVSPFTVVPAYLDSTISTNESTVKPRVTLVIDDSGSMSWAPLSGVSGKSKLKIVQDVLGQLIGGGNSSNNQKEDFSKNIKYNLVPLWANRLYGPAFQGTEVIQMCVLPPWEILTTVVNGLTLLPGSAGFPCTNTKPVQRDYADGATIYSRYIKKMAPGGTTPTTASYVGAVNTAYKNIEYACQKNYVIVLSDGDTNFDMRQFSSLGAIAGSTAADQIRFDMSPSDKFLQVMSGGGVNYDVEDMSLQENTSEKTLKAAGGLVTAWNDFGVNTLTFATSTKYPVLTKIYGLEGREHMPWQYLYAYGNKSIAYTHNYGYPDNWPAKPYGQNRNKVYDGIYAKFPELPINGTCAIPLLCAGKGLDRNRIIGYGHQPMDDDGKTPINNGIAFFSHKLYNNDQTDLITTVDANGNKTDKEGNPWTGNQNIQTITIGFGDGLRMNGQQYLKEAAEAYKAYNPVYINENGEEELVVGDDVLQIGAKSDKQYGMFNALSEEELYDTFVKIFTMAIKGGTYNSDLVRTSTAAPSQVTTTEHQIEGRTDYAGHQVYQALVSNLSVRTGNWSSVLSFYYFDGDTRENGLDETANVIHAEYPNIPYKILVGERKSGSYGDIASASPALFGYSGKEQEFKAGFLPWISRAGGLSATADDDIEATVAALNLSERLIDKYRNRVLDDVAEKPEAVYERMMGDVLDASPITLPDTTVDRSIIDYDKKNSDPLIDKARYFIAGSNDGMLYVYRRDKAAEKDCAGSNGTTRKCHDAFAEKKLPYKLSLNYLPAEMPREDGKTLGEVLPAIAQEGYGSGAPKPHIYGINGGLSYVTSAKTFGRKQETIIQANMGQGGRGSFGMRIGGFDATKTTATPIAIDAGDDKSLQAWETASGDTGVKMGYTISKPAMGQLAKNWMLSADKQYGTEHGKAVIRPTEPDVLNNVSVASFISNGHPGADKALHDTYPTLYVFDAMGYDFGAKNKKTATQSASSGQLIKAISVVGDTNADGIMALGSPTAVDTDFDGIIDVVYAGDYSGDLWRFDLRYDGVDNWKAYKIYDGVSTQPITAAPAAYRISSASGLKYVVVFGTGSDIYDADRDDETKRQNKQAIFGIYDDLGLEETTDALGNKQYSNKLAVKTVRKADLLQRKFAADDGSKDPNGRRYRKIETAQCDVKYGEQLKLSATDWKDKTKTVELTGKKLIKSAQPLYLSDECVGKKGWYIELFGAEEDKNGMENLGAEMVVSQPQVLLNSMFVTTRSYAKSSSSSQALGNTSDEETCAGSTEGSSTTIGSSWLIGLNVLNGGMLDEAKFQDQYNHADPNYEAQEIVSSDLTNVVGVELTSVKSATSGSTGGSATGGSTGGSSSAANNDKKETDNSYNISSAVVLMSPDLTNSIIQSTNANGQAGDGELQETAKDVLECTTDASGKQVCTNVIKRNTVPQGNSCTRQSDWTATASLSSSDPFIGGIHAKLCKGSFLRTSIREIKLLD